MNILFLGYWNADDPLTAATIIPHLSIITDNELASELIFSSVQREPFTQAVENVIGATGAKFVPVWSRNVAFNLINKTLDFYLLPKAINRIINNYKIDFIIARGAPAGALAYLATKKNKVPFIVESYEPHADYMREAGVWSKYDPRYIMQKHWEIKVNKKAKYLLTVSEKFKNSLHSKGVPKAKIKVARCAVDGKKFVLGQDKRLRKELSIPKNATVGIYAGKFGGLYYNRETFVLFKSLMQHFSNLYIILLSDISQSFLNRACEELDIDKSRLRKDFVQHDQVSNFLNVADFALAPYRKTKSARYLSPVKLGEYWACGLPVILTEGVGDESEFIETQKLGIALDMAQTQNKEYLESKLNYLKQLIENADKNRIREVALRYRSFDAIKKVYNEVFDA